MLDQYKSNTTDFIQDIVDNYNDWTRSDLQGYVAARCVVTNENENHILQMIDDLLAAQGVGI